MKIIKNFKKFFDKRNIDSICKEYGIKNYTINSDGTIDVDGFVYIGNKKLTKLPLKFGKVSGNFYCDNNQLTTLEGAPKIVRGSFDCSENKLTTLQGGPESVGGYFNCSKNQLTTLVGGPKEVGGLYVLQLGNFNCSYNQLTTLEGCPRVVRNFNCSFNNLTNLIGGPEWVKKKYNASNNQITSFEGFPDKHTGDCIFGRNPVYKILRGFPEHLWKRVIPLINDYDAIWRGEVIPERLEMIKEKLGLS